MAFKANEKNPISHLCVVNAKKYHNFFNGGEEDRIHLVATLPYSKTFTDKKYAYAQLWG